MSPFKRRLPIGAEVFSEGVHFRVWAPKAKKVEVILHHENGTKIEYPLHFESEENGYYSGLVKEAQNGSLYFFRLNGEEKYPDPASRFQPDGTSGYSQVVDPSKYIWNDQHWKGVNFDYRVIYEMHIGTFTQQGDWSSAKNELKELADLGITIIQLMPVNEFPGKFGWGYDGVNLFAPFHCYGKPDELRAFIDQSHQLGIAVVLDVVYNHFGPAENYIRSFSDHYFTSQYSTEWGEAINFDGQDSRSVREFFLANAVYWIDEYHFDGLRIDATQNIYDSSSPHILSEISQRAREIAPNRQLYLVAENELQQSELVHPIEKGGYGMNAVWNDDFHHSAIVRLTGKNECYYQDYLGTSQEFISTIKYGYLFQGQWYLWKSRLRGTPTFQLDPSSFINFIQNHDQIANSALCIRIHLLTDPGNYRAMTALMLLAPGTPLLFQGQEFAASSPFYYFADHSPELAELILKGRREYFMLFPCISSPEIQANLANPANPETFLKSKLNFNERRSHFKEYALHQDLLKLRRHDPIFRSSRFGGIDGAVLSNDAFLLRYFGDGENTRLLIINFGVDLSLSPIPEPLLAPPRGKQWEILWSSEDLRYGGAGTPPLTTDQNWKVVGHSAIVLIPKKS